MTDDPVGRDPYAEVLADLRLKRDDIDNLIRKLETMRGGSPASAAETVAKTDSDGAHQSGSFLGMSIAEAAKKLLAAKRRTMNSGDIAIGLEAGGLHMTAAEPANVVGSVLTRRFNTSGDIVRVSRGQWGLAEWYPNRSFRKKIKSDALESVAPADDIIEDLMRAAETSDE